MKRLFSWALILTVSLPAASVAQAPGSGPIASALKAALQRAARVMPAAADLMPAEKYGFRPTPEQMSFGEILAHEAESNQTLCGAIAGGAAPPSESAAGATASKEQLIDRIKQSFDYCGTVIDRLDEATLGDSVPFFGGRKVTRARAAIGLAQDWADHYAQVAMYLRANGILPPTARPRG
jgi:DinB superfamily